MHIADEIIKEVEENKIVDIFSEPDKTKILLQLKELELIAISENGVVITDEGRRASENGIRSYFREKKVERAQMQTYVEEAVEEEKVGNQKWLTIFPTFIFLILVLGLAWILFAG